MRPNTRTVGRRRRTVGIVLGGFFAVGPVFVFAQWPQWGGVNRDFVVSTSGLAAQWPADGPKKVWDRELGAGYSAIVVDQGVLYTMYRTGDDEVVVALDAETGKTRWEKKYPAPLFEGMETQYGKGPNSTPLVHGDYLYTIGVAGLLHCLENNSGKVVWSADLRQSQGAKMPEFGYSASPLAYKDRLIVPGGGPGFGVYAFDLKSGSILWNKHDFVNVYSSPILIRVGGADQVVLLADTQVIGFNPMDGELRWKFPHENQWKTNISTPVWGEDQLLYITSGGEAGSRALRLTPDGDNTKVEEVWGSKKMSIGQGNVVRVGDFVYGSSGNEGPMFLTAINVKTGELGWRERGFSKAMLLYADGKLIVLDEDGNLALAQASPTELKVGAKVQMLKKPSWTGPTLVGKRLYLRDTERIMALDVG